MNAKPRRGGLILVGLLFVLLGVAVPVGLVQAASNDGPSACEASARTLGGAIRAYSNNCSQPRVDCDPIDGMWVCSSEQLGKAKPNTPVVVVTTATTARQTTTATAVEPTSTQAPATTTAQPTTSSSVSVGNGECATVGSTRAIATRAYNNVCTEKLVDCDPLDGGWICANVWLKSGRLPSGNPPPTSAPTPTTTAAPTTVTSTTVTPTTVTPTTAAPTTQVTTPPTTKAPTTQTTQPPTTMPGHHGHGVKPHLPNGFLPGSVGSSDLEIVNRSKDTRSIPANIATFRMDCNYSHMNFDDAIVKPGQPGDAHLHVYFGNTTVDAYSDPMKLSESGNSTCAGGRANRSAYWVPAVIDTKNGNRPLQPESSIIYYKLGWDGGNPSKVQAPPNGLRMVSGNQNNSERIRANHPDNRITNWACTSKGQIKNNRLSDIFPTDCKPGELLVVRVAFPQCWDGKNLDSPDHKSHMAYLNGSPNNRRDCPSSHPVLIPRMTINAYFKLNSTDTSGLRLASDSYDKSIPGGLSAHGDWIVGWDQPLMERMLNGCFRPADDCGHNNFNDGQGLRYPRR